MPAAAPVVLNDGTADHTYGPENNGNNTSLFVDKSAGQANLFVPLTMGVRRNAKTGTHTADLQFTFGTSYTDTTSDLLVPGDSAIVKMSFIYGQSLTSAQRAKVIAMAVDSLADGVVLGVVRDLGNVY